MSLDPDAPQETDSEDTAARVDSLLDRMTLEEKVAQLGSIRVRELLTDDGTFDPAAAAEELDDGIGHITRPGGAGHLAPQDAARFCNAVQEYLREETRLGIPAILHEESLLGYMGPGGTTYPQAIGLASTWEPDLVRKISGQIRRQLNAIGTSQTLSPVLDLARDPRWGRVEETYGEDQYLVGRMASAYVSGIQNGGSRRDPSATLKHFAGHGATAGGKNRASLHLGPRRLEEHLFPFEATIKRADAESVMNAYHDIDGVPCAANEDLLTDTLRHAWGFDGTVVADYNSVRHLQAEHRVADSPREAACQAFEAGIDVELPEVQCYDELVGAVHDGDVAESSIDAAVRRVLRQKLEHGLFEDPTVDVASVPDAFETEDQRALARRAARESVTLLNNEDDLLPLNDPGSIALVGPKLDAAEGLLGDYGYLARNDAQDHAAIELVTPREAITERVGSERVSTAKGCTLTGSETAGIDDAVETASAADVAVAFVGANSAISFSHEASARTPTSGEGTDITDLGLPGQQQALIEAVAATDTPLVLVLISGKPHAIEWAAEHVPAIVHAWLPGEEGGNGIAEVLFGEHTPSGRLPVSIPRSAGQGPVHYNRHPNTAEKGHVFTDSDALYAFGHGESYTSFAYRDLTLSAESVGPAGTITATVTVENTGGVAGTETVQLYSHQRSPSIATSVQQLRGFQRVHLEPGERKRISIELEGSQLAVLDRDLNRVVEPGEYELRTGHAADDIRQTKSFEITGDVWRVPDSAREFFAETRIE